MPRGELESVVATMSMVQTAQSFTSWATVEAVREWDSRFAGRVEVTVKELLDDKETHQENVGLGSSAHSRST